MNNLTAREKGFMYVITLLIIVVLGYFFGIRTLNNKYEEYKAQLKSLQERKAYLDQLRANNASMATEIELLKSSCAEIELSFIDELETECIEQYVLKTFEDAGCPFLMSVSSSDIGMPSVTYADGSSSKDGLVCMQILVNYSSTDGYTVTQYNRTPDFTPGAKTPVAETVETLSEQMGQGEYAKRKGYDEFLAALKKINAENPDCIKVSGLMAQETNGVMTLSATIDFYGVSLRNRLSIDDSKKPYTYWCGDKNVDTKGGFIGFPYVCDNKNSLWYGVVNMNFDAGAVKPFAAYWSNALFEKQVAEAGGDIKKLLNFGEETPTTSPTPTPAAA
jgi:cell division protein FtsB